MIGYNENGYEEQSYKDIRAEIARKNLEEQMAELNAKLGYITNPPTP